MKKKAEKHELANLKTLSKRNIQSERVKVSTKYLDVSCNILLIVWSQIWQIEIIFLSA